jgi:serine protease AprX
MTISLRANGTRNLRFGRPFAKHRQLMEEVHRWVYGPCGWAPLESLDHLEVNMRKFAVAACFCILACSASAATLPGTPAPGTPARGAAPSRLADHDGDRISDGLQGALGRAVAGDLLNVVVTSTLPGSAAEARNAVGPFQLRREFTLIHGFAASMTPGQIRALAQRPGIVRIEEDFIVHTQMDAARADFGVDTARANFGVSGAGIKGCIVDTGVDPHHEQLDKQAIPFFDAVGGATTPYDDNGHGTHVASIAFGDGVGGTGANRYRGVAPGVAIHAAKVLDSSGSGPESQVIAGIEWCVSQGVHIISMSLGSAEPSDGADALSQAANSAVASGVVVVVAAGNAGDGPGTVGAPGAAAQVITVAACADRSAAVSSPNHSEGMYLAPFSSRGPTLDNRTKPDVCAPGHTITAAKAGTVSEYITYSGTSMATPFVAGTVALGLQGHALSPAQIKQAIEATAQDRGPAGKDNDWGAGLLDANAFVASAGGIPGATPTPFPTARRVSASVGNNGLWSYSFNLTASDLGIPIAASVTIDGQEKCTLFLLGICFSSQWDPDLEARLVDPNGVILSESTCLAGNECGVVGRQETVHAMPTVVGAYKIEVYPAADSGNQGKGGTFSVDLSTGPLSGGTGGGGGGGGGTPPPAVHVGALTPSATATKSGWRASVTVTVHDASHVVFTTPATVTGAWSGGYSGTSTCVTSNGQCTLTTGSIAKKKNSATFSVTNISGPVAYQPANNDVTSVTVNRPQ